MEPDRDVRVDVWSDLVCPWCYVGKRRLERAVASRPSGGHVRIVHRAYLLYGHLPKGSGVDRRTMLMAKYGLSGGEVDAMNARMRHVAAAEGLDYQLDGIATGNTFDAHQLVYLAREFDAQDAVLERLFQAFFLERRSIFERDALVALGVEAGLDRQVVERAFEADAYAMAVQADVASARDSGVAGVPFFAFNGGQSIAGAQDVDVFRRALA